MKKSILFYLIISSFYTITIGQNEYWAGFAQGVDVTAYQGLSFRVTAAVKVVTSMEQATADIWVRGHKKDRKVGFMERTTYLKKEAKQEWKVLSIEGVLDQEVVQLLVGGYCAYNGQFYFDAFQLQVLQDGTWQNIPLDNSDFENTKFEHPTFLGTTSPRKMIQGWGGFIAEENRATFTPMAVSEEVYEGTSALLVEGKGYFYAPTYLKKYVGAWDWEYMATLSDDFVESLPPTFNEWTALHNGFALKEVLYGEGTGEIEWETYLVYYPDLDKVVWNIIFADGPPRLFEGKLDEKGNLSFQTTDSTFSSEDLKESYHLTWINDDELSVVWNFYMPNFKKNVKRQWKVTRRKAVSNSTEKP